MTKHPRLYPLQLGAVGEAEASEGRQGEVSLAQGGHEEATEVKRAEVGQRWQSGGGNWGQQGGGEAEAAQVRQACERPGLESVEWIVAEIKMLQLWLASREADLQHEVVTQVESLEAGGQWGHGLEEVVGEVNADHTVQGVEAGDLGDVVVMKVEDGQPRSGLALVTRDRGQPVVAQVQGLEALEAEEVGDRGQSVVRQNQRGQPDVVDPGGLLKW